MKRVWGESPKEGVKESRQVFDPYIKVKRN